MSLRDFTKIEDKKEEIIYIPSVSKFEYYVEKEKIKKEELIEKQVKEILKNIEINLNNGDYKIEDEMIAMNIDHKYSDESIDKVNTLFVENGWRKIVIEFNPHIKMNDVKIIK